MNDQIEKRGTPFPQQAAQVCLFAPLIALVLGIFTSGLPQNQSSTRLVIGIMCMGLVAAGTILGIVALAGIRKHGAKGILVR